jgi:hypothetical protein
MVSEPTGGISGAGSVIAALIGSWAAGAGAARRFIPVFRAPPFLALLLRAEVFFAVDPRRDDFLAADFLRADFRLADFLPVVRRDVDLRVDLRAALRTAFRVDFRAADFRRADFFAALRFRPALRADFFRPPFLAAIGNSPRFEDHPATLYQKHWRHPSLFDRLPRAMPLPSVTRFHISLTT